MSNTRCPIPSSLLELMQREAVAKTLRTPLAEVLPIRTVNALEEAGMIWVHQLVQVSPQDLAQLPNFGPATIAAVGKALAQLGLSLRHPTGNPQLFTRLCRERSLSRESRNASMLT